jgi:hypothetical protein
MLGPCCLCLFVPFRLSADDADAPLSGVTDKSMVSYFDVIGTDNDDEDDEESEMQSLN